METNNSSKGDDDLCRKFKKYLKILIICIFMGMILTSNSSGKPQNALGQAIISGANIDTIGSVGSHLNVSHTIIESINSSLFVSSQTLGSLMEEKAIITPKMQKVIECESRGDNNAIGDKNYYKNGKISPSYGIAQFQKSTFYWMSELSGIYGDINNENDQLILMKWAFDNGYASHWSCYKILYESKI